MLLADRVSFTERPTDVIGPAVNPVDFSLSNLAHEFEHCADEIDDGFKGNLD